jgi:hypothetical protein
MRRLLSTCLCLSVPDSSEPSTCSPTIAKHLLLYIKPVQFTLEAVAASMGADRRKIKDKQWLASRRQQRPRPWSHASCSSRNGLESDGSLKSTKAG